MGIYGAQPEELHRGGVAIKEQASELGKYINEIYTLVDTLLNSGYISPDAKALAQSMKNQKSMLLDMQYTINRYGEFAQIAANRTVNTSDDISSNFH